MDKTSPINGWLPRFLQRDSKQKLSSNDSPPNETSSFLPKLDNHYGASDREEGDSTYILEESDAPALRKVWTEWVILFRGSIPVILAYALQNSLQTISVVIVGRRSPEDLATAAFAYMFAMTTAWLIALGGTTALDTLGSSSFTGSKDKHALGILLQRAFVVLGLFYIPVIILWTTSEPLFKALGQSEQLSRDSHRFLCCLLPGGLGYIYFEAMKKYLQAQGSCSVSHHVRFLLTPSRDHEARNIRPPHHLASQRRTQLPLRVHLRNRPTWSTYCNWNLVLAVVLPPRGVHSFRRWLRVLGWLVEKMLAEYGHIFPTGRSRRTSCGD